MRHFLLLALFLVPSFLSATDNRHIGARSAGLGNASVTFSDLWSVHHNQAGLAFVERISFGLYYENRFLLPELGLKGGAAALPVGSGVFGLSVSSFGYSLYSESKYGLAYARKFGDNFSIGIQLDYLQTRIAENYGISKTLAAEIGVQGKLNENLSIGAHIFNINRAKIAEFLVDSITDYTERAPTILRLGMDYKFSEKVFVAVETEKDMDQKAVMKVGVEYQVSELFYLRVGVSSNPFLSTFGFGVMFKEFRLDFATSYHSVLGYSPHISLSYDIK